MGEYGKFGAFIEAAARDEYVAKLSATEDWLYDEGDEAELVVYLDKFDELSLVGAPVKRRAVEAEGRAAAVIAVDASIVRAREFVANVEGVYAHITAEKRQPCLDGAAALETARQTAQASWDSKPKFDDAEHLVADLIRQKDALDATVNTAQRTPKPKIVDTPKEEEKKEETKDTKDEADGAADMEK